MKKTITLLLIVLLVLGVGLGVYINFFNEEQRDYNFKFSTPQEAREGWFDYCKEEGINCNG